MESFEYRVIIIMTSGGPTISTTVLMIRGN